MMHWYISTKIKEYAFGCLRNGLETSSVDQRDRENREFLIAVSVWALSFLPCAS